MMIPLLIKPKILSLKNSLNAKIVLRRLPFVVVGVGFWMMFYMGAYKVLYYIRSIEFFGEILSMKLFAMTFFSLLGFLILSNIITAISTFYSSKDIPFLLSMPIGIRDIIRLKTFETVLNSSWMVVSFIPPVFIAYGVSYNAPISYYSYIFPALILFILITAGIGISAAHLLARIFPAKKAGNALLVIGIIFLLALYFIMKSAIPGSFSAPEDLINSFMTFKMDSHFLPSYWIAESILPMLKNESPKIFYLLLLLSNCAFFLLLSAFTGLGFYRRNLEKIQSSDSSRRKGFLGNFYPEGSAAIFYKDSKILFRDAGQWSQIFIIGALVAVYIYNFKSIPVNAFSELSPFVKELMVMINMILAGLVLSAVAARFIYASVSVEGRAFWIIRTSPVDTGKFLWSKFLYGCLPVTLLVVFLVFITDLAMNVKGLLLLSSVATTLMICISVSGLGTGFGAMYPKFKYENIAAVSMSLGGMAFMLIAFSVVLITLSLEAWIFYVYKIRSAGFAGMIQIAISILLILFVNAAAFYLPMRIGRRKLQEQAGLI